MYEAYFGMAQRPFSLTPDPAFLFMSKKHRFAFSMIEYALTGQAGFTVITGDIGSGKTTLIRHLLTRSHRGINYGVISNTHESFGSLLQWVLTAFGITSPSDDRAGMYRAFVDYLIGQFAQGKQTIVIVDEAQNLSVELLEELRLLSNIYADKDQLLQMILVGQPELLEKLRRPELVQFAQRISVNYHLSPLGYAETSGYIHHRLQIAGADPELFSEAAIKAVFHFTNGVPRLINSICDMACVYGYADGAPGVDIDTILAVIYDKEKGGLLPLYNSAGSLDRDALCAAIEASVSASCAKDGPIEKPAARVAPQAAPVVRMNVEPIGAGARIASNRYDSPNAEPRGTTRVARADASHRSGAPEQTSFRLAPGNSIVPIMSQRSRDRTRPEKVHWLFRIF